MYTITTYPATEDLICTAGMCRHEGCLCTTCDEPAAYDVTVTHIRYSKSRKAKVADDYREAECQVHKGYWADFHGVSA